MAHWAEIDENNKVLRVLVGDNNDPNGDEGYQWLIDNLGGTWIKTSYNAVGGKRRDPETGQLLDLPGFRKNYAGVDFVYDEEKDAFIPPQPFPSWILNEDTCLWEPPIPAPTDSIRYVWDEPTVLWREI